MKLLNFEVWFYIYLTNTKKIFLKDQKRIKLLYTFLLNELNKGREQCEIKNFNGFKEKMCFLKRKNKL